jgi:hypothetical protein
LFSQQLEVIEQVLKASLLAPLVVAHIQPKRKAATIKTKDEFAVTWLT